MLDTGITMRQAREASGLTYSAFAAAIGISKASLSRYENDAWPVPRKVELALAAFQASHGSPAKESKESGGTEAILAALEPVLEMIRALPTKEKVAALNLVKLALHEESPFNGEPVDCVLWVENKKVKANDYNPNKVAPPEMTLLTHSIREDGYTQPIVTHDNGGKTLEVVDGFHRHKVGKGDAVVRERVQGYLPVVVINGSRGDKKDRIAATIRHNRARGVHGVRPMSDIVADLVRRGWKDGRIAVELGMEPDEVLRLKQNTGLADIFKGRDFSKSWS